MKNQLELGFGICVCGTIWAEATVTDLLCLEQIFSSDWPAPNHPPLLLHSFGVRKDNRGKEYTLIMTTQWVGGVYFELFSPGQQVAVFAGHTGDVMSLRYVFVQLSPTHKCLPSAMWTFFIILYFSLSPDYKTFVSGACDASAKVKIFSSDLS